MATATKTKSSGTPSKRKRKKQESFIVLEQLTVTYKCEWCCVSIFYSRSVSQIPLCLKGDVYVYMDYLASINLDDQN